MAEVAVHMGANADNGVSPAKVGLEPLSDAAVQEQKKEEDWDPDDDLPCWDMFGFTRRLLMSKSQIPDKLKRYGVPGVGRLDHFFLITERGSTFMTEFVGGTVTFFSMAYIMALNPIIVSGAIGLQWKEGLFFATVVASGIFTVAMGFFANLPVALAPGMGLNGYFANIARVSFDGTLVGVLTWQQGYAAIMMAGIIYIFLTVTGVRFLLFRAVPDSIKHAISGGIGLFICIIGYKIGCILGINYYGGPISTFTAQIPFFNYDIAQINPAITPAGRLTVLGLVFVAFFLTLRFRAGILIAIVLTTVCGITGDGLGPDSVTSLKVWHEDPIPFLVKTQNLISGHMDTSIMGTTRFWDVTWTFLFVEMFDSFGTLSTVLLQADVYKGNKKRTERAMTNAMLVDGWGSFLGAFIGSNSITVYIESLTGIATGARTGLAAVVTGAYFLLSLLFVFPFVAIIPDSATVPALFMVGVYSLESVRHIDFDDFPTAFASFMIIATMPFTYSIANGIAAGFIFYNLCAVTRWLHFRAAELFSRKVYPKDPEKWMWESGWNTEHPTDYLPHWVMVLFGLFMVLRYRFFFS